MNLPACSRDAWRWWALTGGIWLAALLPGFLVRFPLPPTASLVTPAWWLSFSGSKYGLPLVGLPALLFIGLGAAFNEHLLKPWMNEPRPNIRWLASQASGPVLPEGTKAFYRIPGKEARSSRLQRRLAQSGLALPPLLSGHWIAETGFSFPSGHAFATAALGGWFLYWMLCWRRRLWLVPVIGLWGAGVGWSRLVLGVHDPGDVVGRIRW